MSNTKSNGPPSQCMNNNINNMVEMSTHCQSEETISKASTLQGGGKGNGKGKAAAWVRKF